MAQQQRAEMEQPGFDVTCVVGRVLYGDSDYAPTPFAAALRLIGEHGTDGEYRFPNDSDGWVTVTVKGVA